MNISALLSFIACSHNEIPDRLESPTLVWSVEAGAPVAQIVDLGEMLAVRTEEGKILGISADGEWRWTLTFTAPIAGDAAPLGPWLAVATTDRVHLVDPVLGEVVRSHRRYDGGGLAPAGADAIVRDGSVIERCSLRDDEDLVCTSLTEARAWGAWSATGDAVFATDGSDLLRRGSGDSWSFSAHGAFAQPPLIATSTVIAGSEDGNVYAVYADDGSPRWTFTPTSPVSSRFAMDEQNAYFTSNDGYLYAIQRSTGTLRWRANPERAVATAALVDDSTLLYGSEDGTLEALSTDWAEPLWSFNLGSKPSAPLIAAAGGTVVGTTDGRVQRIAAHEQDYPAFSETGGAP